ncbi:GGDEF domain-containing protein [Agrobacterium vaccinii]|uniref:GGDEF domain-containing protein n=1 Tax=Agrobacterium vaccinii TaxID=2735528 RepID=UPI001E6317BB|nr:GGDEF domain-containing protein [Agrobacterium vaccinii]
MAWIESFMVLIGIGLLAGSLEPISAILRLHGKGPLHRSWQFLRGLIVVFIAGYTLFMIAQFTRPHELSNIIASSILMMGGAFVVLVSHLSASTTSEVMRVAKLEADVVRDPLTGAFNRRFMDATLPIAMATARRTQRPLSAILVDLDHFKGINDTYGHPIGDLVLKQLSGLIIEGVRACDLLVRYGGEEFLVISPETCLEAATALGERVRQLIAAGTVVLPDGRIIRTTASIGVASLSMNDDEDDLLTRADQALYSAKTNGRNQVCNA